MRTRRWMSLWEFLLFLVIVFGGIAQGAFAQQTGVTDKSQVAFRKD